VPPHHTVVEDEISEADHFPGHVIEWHGRWNSVVIAASRHRPHIHGVKDERGSHYWALSESKESNNRDEDSEGELMFTPESVHQACAEGFTISQLEEAGKEIIKPIYVELSEQSMFKKIIDMVRHQHSRTTPWTSQLPKPSSPPMTIGDALKAMTRIGTNAVQSLHHQHRDLH
jgi:hypothetical protein